MIEFWQRHQDKIVTAGIEHIQLVVMAVCLAFVCCIPLFLLGRLSEKLNTMITIIVNMIYTIPSMALFALCVPVVGIGRPAALLALTLYNLFVIYKNLNTGFNSVSHALIEAGMGMGYSRYQLFRYVQLPQTLPFIFAGLKLSSTMTVGLATIASIVNGGGLGRLMFDGLNRRYMEEVFWATLISVSLSILFNTLFQHLEDKALAKAHGEG